MKIDFLHTLTIFIKSKSESFLGSVGNAESKFDEEGDLTNNFFQVEIRESVLVLMGNEKSNFENDARRFHHF